MNKHFIISMLIVLAICFLGWTATHKKLPAWLKEARTGDVTAPETINKLETP